jgi:bifunctional non-homologous end joining protein LigD
MTLKKYQAKRKFEQTPEPEGGEVSSQGPLRFVVQLHRASHLHYDFRLELDGTLKSWAVPKGPSLNPEDKRFAVMVEDHPLDYRTFEGVIPKGNYGAGTVMVWDEGTYHSRQTADRAESERILKEGLQKGHITFVVYGKKLKGELALVKLKKGEENGWLLLKKRDEFAIDRDVTEFERSVASNRTLEEIAGRALQAGEVWPAPKKSAVLDLSDVPRSNMPRRVRPMLATTVEKSFDRSGWFYEIKWDGYRAIAEVENQRVRLYSRNQLSLEERFAPLVESLQRLGCEAVLDGEVVVVDETGKPHFQLLQHYQKSREGQLVYFVFDLLHLNGHDLRKLPLTRRKELLLQILPDLPHVQMSDHIEEHGVDFFKIASQKGLEGIIAKDAASPYLEGRRSLSWLKVKTHRRQEAVIGGFTRPRGGRKNFGALLLGVYDHDGLTYIGHTGTGFGEKTLAEIHSRLEPLTQQACPFKKRPVANAPVRWVRPELVCEVTFQEWTEEALMRHPVFVGMRDDKRPSSVRRENPEPVAKVLAEREVRNKRRKPASSPALKRSVTSIGHREQEQLSIDGHNLKLTHLNKVYWPAERYTKRDLVNYYREVAPFILPYLKDRPQSLNRHPDGIESEGFYQKNVENTPPWVKTVKIHSDSGQKDINFLLCQDEATLVYLANLGCIELNPWSSRVGMLERPDYLVIDLDPEDISFDQVIEAALKVREILEQAEAVSVCKTSGKTGLHIYVPLGAQYTYEHGRQLGEIIARLVHRKLPKSTSVVRSPTKRQKKVYLDYLQNRQGQTLAAPYSVRPIAGAPVSTPLSWSEVKPGLDPMQFTIRTLPKRLDRIGDLWRPLLGAGIDVIKCLSRLQRPPGGA